jgi:putative MATE family efflux protein
LTLKTKIGKDLTTGSIPGHILTYSTPMLIGNLARTSYHIINIIWVGHLVGKNAVGAVGVSFPIIFILIGIFIGMSLATTILVAQYYGAKKYDMVEKVVNNSFLLSLIIGGFFTITGILSSDFLLKLMDTPPENFAMASSYLKLNLAGFTLLYIDFLIHSILRGIGNTMIPLVFSCIAMGLNAIIDPFFIGGFGPFPLHGLNGAAYATLISEAVSLVISIMYLNKKDKMVAFNLKKLIFDKHITSLIFRIGLPSVAQQSLVSLSVMFITTFVNAFGNAATNAFGAVGRIDMFVFLPAMSMGMAVSALTGQNLGAGKPERIKDIFKWGNVMTSSITIFISFIVVFLARPILIMFGLGNDVNVMNIGVSYMRIVGSCYVFFAIMSISSGIINGAGHTIITMFFTFLSLWAIRVPLAWFLSKTLLGLTGIWIATSLSFIITMIISLIYYFSGRWRKSVIGKTSVKMKL